MGNGRTYLAATENSHVPANLSGLKNRHNANVGPCIARYGPLLVLALAGGCVADRVRFQCEGLPRVCMNKFGERRRHWILPSLMASDLRVHGLAFVIMGVSGTGKSTVAEMFAKALDCSFLEADDYHSQANKEKMKEGIPLTDEDRFPWLEALRDATMKIMISGRNITLACSALQKKYREILRYADPDYKPGQYPSCRVRFICLEAPVEVIADRMRRRSRGGKHFMPASLLQSQLDLLQIDEHEGITKVDATASLEAIMDSIKQASSCTLTTLLETVI